MAIFSRPEDLPRVDIPFIFIDRITRVEPPPWVLKPDGWIEAEYDVPPDAWYFRADRSGHMPFCVLLEIALQPCGWLAAYAGSALKSKKDLKFRNLGGEAVLHHPVLPGAGRLTMRARMTQVAEAYAEDRYPVDPIALLERAVAKRPDYLAGWLALANAHRLAGYTALHYKYSMFNIEAGYNLWLRNSEHIKLKDHFPSNIAIYNLI